jgi:3-oxoacyl-[acyl-carrier-protein] synthase-1
VTEPADIAVTAAAALTPGGHSVAESCAAIRARMSAFAELPFLMTTRDPEWDPRELLRGAAVPGVSVAQPPGRLADFGLVVLRQLVEQSRLQRSELGRCALLLCLPEPDAVADGWQLEQTLPELLCARGGLPPFATVRAHAGHTAALRLVDEAHQLMAVGQASACLLLAVDSYLGFERLRLLDAGHRIRSDRNKDGFIPGEAAIALMLEPARGASRPPLCTLGRPSVAVEPHSHHTDRSSTGRGLQLAIEGALGAADRPASWVVCDLNGESYRSFEWGTVRTRLAERFADLRHLVHPADCVGDVGSAAGGLLLACVAQAFARGYAPAPHALLWTASEDGTRAALLANRPS